MPGAVPGGLCLYNNHFFTATLILDQASEEKKRLEEKQRAARKNRSKSEEDWKTRCAEGLGCVDGGGVLADVWTTERAHHTLRVVPRPEKKVLSFDQVQAERAACVQRKWTIWKLRLKYFYTVHTGRCQLSKLFLIQLKHLSLL